MVRTGRFGFHSLFYHADARGGLSLSPSLLTLLEQGAPTDLDDRALAVFLRMGFYVGEDTPFRAIRVMPPGATLVWHEGRIELSASEYEFPRASDLSRDAALDGFIDVFQAAVRRLAPGEKPFALPLSAGRDSRHILLGLAEAGHRPQACITLRHFPPRLDHDVRVAAQLAGSFGLPHVVLDQRQARFEAETRKNIMTHFCSDEHAWFLPLVDHIGGRYPLVYDGIAGDILSSRGFLTERKQRLVEQGDFTGLADAVLFGEGHHRLPRLIRPEARARLGRDVAVDRLYEELRKHADAANPVNSFYFWNRTRREIALSAFGMLGEVTEVRAPFLDPDVYEFLAALPGHLVLDNKFHTDAIQRGYPRHASIPFEADGLEGPSGQSGFGNLGEAAIQRLREGRHFVPFGLRLAGRTCGRPASRLVNTPYLAFRVLAGTFRPLDDGDATLGPLGLYLLQLEEVAARASRASRPSALAEADRKVVAAASTGTAPADGVQRSEPVVHTETSARAER